MHGPKVCQVVKVSSIIKVHCITRVQHSTVLATYWPIWLYWEYSRGSRCSLQYLYSGRWKVFTNPGWPAQRQWGMLPCKYEAGVEKLAIVGYYGCPVFLLSFANLYAVQTRFFVLFWDFLILHCSRISALN